MSLSDALIFALILIAFPAAALLVANRIRNDLRTGESLLYGKMNARRNKEPVWFWTEIAMKVVLLLLALSVPTFVMFQYLKESVR